MKWADRCVKLLFCCFVFLLPISHFLTPNPDLLAGLSAFGLLRSFAKKCKHFFASFATRPGDLLAALAITGSSPDRTR